MNEFQSIESGQGLLKDYYVDKGPVDQEVSALQAALRKKRKKLKQTLEEKTDYGDIGSVNK